MSKMRKLEMDAQNLYHLMMDNKDFKSMDIFTFKDDRKKEVFNAIYNEEYTFDLSEYTVNRLITTISYGKKLFGLFVYKFKDEIYMYKETNKETVLIVFEKLNN